MDKIKLNDSYEIPVTGSNMGELKTVIEDYSELNNLSKIISKENTKKVEAMDGEYVLKVFKDLIPIEPKFKTNDSSGVIEILFGFRQKTKAETEKENMEKILSILDDSQALIVKNIYTDWNEDSVGYHYSMDNPKDARRQYNGKLWKLKKSHEKQLDWYPGSEPTLWQEIIEGHAGTITDPIPVPESVNFSGFLYVYGKYYSELGKIYLAKRDGKKDGDTETLYYKPSELIGQYFELIGQDRLKQTEVV